MEYRCNICIKQYKTYQTLWTHNKKFHACNTSKTPRKTLLSSQNTSVLSQNTSKNSQNTLSSSQNTSVSSQNTSKINKLECVFCNKIFSRKDNLNRHNKKCKNKEINNNKIKQLETTINELKAQVQSILKEKGKIHHKTLQKINNQLTNNTNNINNGNIMNNTYVKFGELDYEKILNNKQVKNILHKQFRCLEESIKHIHFNDELPEYNNIFITNMKDNIAYVFNGKQFITVMKNEMLNELIDIHVNEINLSLEKNKNKINEYYVNKIEEFLNKLNDDNTKFTDHNNNRTYNNYKAYKINSVKLLIYNESDKKKLETLNGMILHKKTYDEID